MTAKNCPGCGHKVNAAAKFCPDCGSPLAAAGGATPKRQAGGRKIPKDTIIIVSVIIVATAGFFLFKSSQEMPQPTATSEFAHPDVGGVNAASMTSGISFPTDYNSLIALGNQTMDQGNYPVAAEAYRRALVIEPHSPDVRTDYGACLHGMGLPDRALQEFRTVLADHPEHVIANFNMGIVYYNLQRPDSARAYWNNVLALKPDSNLVRTVRQYLSQIDG